jgi:hypothetical protein
MRGQPSFEAAAALVAFLESPGSVLLYDEHGNSCHSEAVATLVSFGPAYAHLVPANELQKAKRRLSTAELQALRRSRQQAATFLGAGTLSALGLIGWFLMQGGTVSSLAIGALVAAGVSVASVAALLKALPIPRAHRGPAVLLVLAAGISFAATFGARWDPLGMGLVSALTAAGLALVVLASWRDPLES